MCGIAGVIGFSPAPEILSAMSQSLIHRGPDDEGIFRNDLGGFAFRRLAILDLEGGHQPMSNSDGRVTLIFNGEIYNHRELRQILEKRGYNFFTDRSDTEVLVHGWDEWGYELFSKLNGMFAVAIWDDVRRKLILARDRYGIKPLYYAPLPKGAVVFASEIKAIHASQLIPKYPSPEGILEYFSFQNLWQEQTMFQGIYQLDPGVILTWDNGKLNRQRYWDITFPRSRTEDLPALVEEHREILKQAITRHIVADVPVVSYLSGGIDSTSITAVARQQNPKVTAYSCIFDLTGVREDRFVDEREFSRLVAKAYNINRVELELSPDSLIGCIRDYVLALEDLRMGMGYPVYLIAQRVARDAKVVLAGTGGDEFHAGYIGRYKALGLLNTNSSLSKMNWLTKIRQFKFRNLLSVVKRNSLQSKESPNPEIIYRKILNSLFNPTQLRQVFTPEFLEQTNGYDSNEVMSQFINQCPSSDWRDRVMYVDVKTYLMGLLTLEDKLSMAHSLETRVPLLDNELVDFLLDIPFSMLCKKDTGKVIFREAVKPFVPHEIYTKPKMGFGPPDSSWYRNQLQNWIEGILSRKHIELQGIFQAKFVQNLLEEHFTGKRNNTYFIWSILNFSIWHSSFKL